MACTHEPSKIGAPERGSRADLPLALLSEKKGLFLQRKTAVVPRAHPLEGLIVWGICAS